MIAAIQHALYGLDNHRRTLDTAAENIARAGLRPRQGEAPPVDLVREMVNLIVTKHGFAANVQTVRVADEMLGSLLDTFA